jgi:5-methyltetrahydropteroyltriglutamate--homocysteine methyltransferase
MATPYRADHLGSFLRPPEVLEARAALAEGKLDQDGLTKIEDDAILEAIELQRQTGVDIFTDGEFRRGSFLTSFGESVEGIAPTSESVSWEWHGPEGGIVPVSLRVVADRLKQTRRLTGQETAFMMAHSPGPIKITVPSPSLLIAMGSYKPGITDSVYPTRSALLQEMSAIINNEVKAVVDEGIQYVQIDAPNYGRFCDEADRQRMRESGIDPDQAFEEAIAADVATLEGVDRDGVTLGLHVCRGNNRSRWLNSGGCYEPIAERLFSSIPVDAFLLEYDTDRSGGFEPLRFIPQGKTVVLGSLTTKEGTLESQDFLLRRIDEAAQYVPLDNLALSPQCGFASVSAGNLLSVDQQRRKLELVVETAREVWS